MSIDNPLDGHFGSLFTRSRCEIIPCLANFTTSPIAAQDHSWLPSSSDCLVSSVLELLWLVVAETRWLCSAFSAALSESSLAFSGSELVPVRQPPASITGFSVRNLVRQISTFRDLDQRRERFMAPILLHRLIRSKTRKMQATPGYQARRPSTAPGVAAPETVEFHESWRNLSRHFRVIFS